MGQRVEGQRFPFAGAGKTRDDQSSEGRVHLVIALQMPREHLNNLCDLQSGKPWNVRVPGSKSVRARSGH